MTNRGFLIAYTLAIDKKSSLINTFFLFLCEKIGCRYSSNLLAGEIVMNLLAGEKLINVYWGVLMNLLAVAVLMNLFARATLMILFAWSF